MPDLVWELGGNFLEEEARVLRCSPHLAHRHRLAFHNIPEALRRKTETIHPLHFLIVSLNALCYTWSGFQREIENAHILELRNLSSRNAFLCHSHTDAKQTLERR